MNAKTSVEKLFPRMLSKHWIKKVCVVFCIFSEKTVGGSLPEHHLILSHCDYALDRIQ